MEKIVYLKLVQIVLTLAFIWHLRSLHQFCGTSADSKLFAFLHDISVGYCESFTLIGKDSKTGEFDAVFDADKWQNQLSMSSTNGQPTEEQKCQFIDFLVAKLPPAGRLCIPITISPFDWIGKDMNLFSNGTLFHFSLLLWAALWSLVSLGIGTLLMLLLSVEAYELIVNCLAFHSAFCWCFSVVNSSILLLDWTDFWTCFNFQADQTIVPLITLVLSIVMMCLYVSELFFNYLLLKKRLVCASTAAEEAHHHELRKHNTTCAIE